MAGRLNAVGVGYPGEMKASLRLGRVAGVAIGLHWSVLGVVTLLVVYLSVRLSAAYPGYPAGTHVIAGVGAAVLFVLSLLAHELAHAVVARRNGIEVDGITLWLLGGVARLRGEAATPGADFRIAVVGPLMSLLVAVVFAVTTWLAAWGDVGLLWVQTLLYLAAINALLAVFNLVPAAPLDGGRVLRAALWRWRGDRLTASVWSARLGRGFGFLLLALGILIAVRGGAGGLWWVLIGLFVVAMASAEEQHAHTSAKLAGLRVRDVMTADPDTAEGSRSVAEFLQETALLRKHSAFPLLDEKGQVDGLITLNRLKGVPTERRATTTLHEAACPPERIPVAEPDEALPELLTKLDGCGDGRALVLADGRLVGIVSPSDISRAVALRGLGAELNPGGADLSQVR